jgi:uncharacterized protein (DUF342 family)
VDKVRFVGKTLESCLTKASEELNISVDLIKYDIINEKTGFFKKSCTIDVYLQNSGEDEKEEAKEKLEEKTETTTKRKLGLVKIIDGNLIISDPTEGNEKATIIKGSGITLKVDDKEVAGKVQVTSESKIEVIFPEEGAKRELNIKVSEDKLLAFATVKYIPMVTYKLEDVAEGRMVTLNSEILKKEYPPKYTKDEIIKELKNRGIIFGISEEIVEDLAKGHNEEEVRIASGQPVTKGEDDTVEIYFKHSSKKEFEVDDSGNIDFKSIGNITSVKKGDVICKRIKGKDGMPGKNIYGQPIQPNRKKEKDIVAKEGCNFIDENTIVATIDGRPEVKGTVFSVHNVYQVVSDVDIKTGNINFIGDVIIHGEVKEGMNVEAGNTLQVNSNVLRAIIKAGGDVEIRGNVISSSIVAGGEYLKVTKYIEDLEHFSNLLEEVYKTVLDVKSNKVIKSNVSDSDLIRAIVDSKYKMFISRFNSLIKCMQEFNDTNNKVFRILHDKFSDVYFSKIKDFQELKTAEELVREKIETLKRFDEMASHLNASYIQDSNVECSGNVYVTSKGVYKSFITAMQGIYLVGQGESNVRGGILRAKHEIKVKTVGTPAGVSTVLAVSKEGHIYCDVAYLNTKFIVGEREFTLYESYKNVHVYIDKDSELAVDKFKL